MAYPDQIYVNGIIVTMDDSKTEGEAVAIRGERIIAVGTTEELLKLAGPATVVTDLQGKTVLPGFYEAHGHFNFNALLEVHNLLLWSPPRGTVANIPQLLDRLREKAKHTPPGQWINGFGYDPFKLEEKRHPTRWELDEAVPGHPVAITHISAHMAVVNSRALELAGIDKDTPPPAEGVIERDQNGELTGLIQENSKLIASFVPPLSPEQYREGVRLANRHYISKGITTAIIALDAEPGPLADAQERGVLDLRLLSIPLYRQDKAPDDLEYHHGPVRTQGVKLFQDGSIQGYTGWLSNPYHVPYSEAEPLFRGFPMLSREELARAVAVVHKAGKQAVIHANGDAAIDDVLYAIEQAQALYPREDARHRIEHAQTVREDQLDRIKELGITPSFFNDHVFYFGDDHRDIFLGEDRARRISPLRSAVERGIRFSLHNDTPVTPADPLHLVSVAVNRLTSSGKELGPEYRITPYQALRAVTIDAAWQAFEEQDKGSIEASKLADLVVLADNPLSAQPRELHLIPVLQTIISGRTVYVKQSAD
ncbi:MAG: hypothetical protein K0R57_5618 [Paenibacillaceae bacterium]|jgi:predicted amidohydrolase YtcJ|nr:hypothetical protein [Paenibacillaceae bacterium]